MTNYKYKRAVQNALKSIDNDGITYKNGYLEVVVNNKYYLKYKSYLQMYLMLHELYLNGRV